MTRAMLASLLLASAMALSPPASPAGPASRQPKAQVSARATARITIISGVSFGPSYLAQPAGAARRSARLIDTDGQPRSAELLEFQ